MNATLNTPPGGLDALPEPIRDALRRRLLTLNYHAFARCLCLLLERLGYEEVRVADRTDWKGRNCGGGYDAKAFLPAGIARRRVIVQMKQYDALPVFQRSVDELRGTCLRAGAAEALLITTSTFSPVIQPPALSPVAPVRLVDGNELLDLLFAHRIGVWEEAGQEERSQQETSQDAARYKAGSKGGDRPRRIGLPRIELDTAFFEELSHRYAGNGRHSVSKRMGRGDAPLANAPFRLLTIQVNLPGTSGNELHAGNGPRPGQGRR